VIITHAKVFALHPRGDVISHDIPAEHMSKNARSILKLLIGLCWLRGHNQDYGADRNTGTAPRDDCSF
jgi:hypothetical protein